MTRTERKAYLNELWMLFWHNKGSALPDWTNRQMKKFIEWNLAYHKLFVVRGEDGSMIAAGVAWRITHPDDFDQINSSLSWKGTEEGNYMYIPYVVVRSGYRNRGTLLILLHMALQRYHGVSQIMFHRMRKGKRVPIITTIPRFLHLLLGAPRHEFQTA